MAKEIRTFTGIRGLAASLIALYHFVTFKTIAPSSPLTFSGAYMSVDAFFILSGFVLAFSYAKTFQHRFQWRDYLQFMYRRFCRIYPAYFALMLLYIAKLIVNVSGDGALGHFTPVDFISNFFMLGTWAINARPIIGPSWSVCVEVFCYIVFPFLVLAVLRNITSAIVSLVVAYAGILLIASLNIGVEGRLDVVFGDTYYPTLRALCGFVIGMSFFKVAPLVTQHKRKWDIAVAASLLLIGISIYGGLGDEITYIGIAVLVFSSSFEGPIAKSIFDNPVSYFLGKISYSLYLVHALLVTLFPKILVAAETKLPHAIGFYLVIAIYFAIAVVFATVSYMLFEVRAQNGLRRLWRPRQEAVAAA
ncbi:acyltransferase [Neorhizobium sp. P12A]|uniref:acyltransferase family protein n=1 Tax=Neorhizobium sp. P12A TaxID=2268027 RepID=UPI0011EFB994|nr:acyltransferase [Neorhizobium sp. P12A]KAA0699906.1 acyltransferase [Neorhizobium sp. P12A]